jgi:hypothetical protein
MVTGGSEMTDCGGLEGLWVECGGTYIRELALRESERTIKPQRAADRDEESGEENYGVGLQDEVEEREGERCRAMKDRNAGFGEKGGRASVGGGERRENELERAINNVTTEGQYE